MRKAFPRFASLGCLVLWLSSFSVAHYMGQLTSQSGVQQGDPLGPFLFALVLHKVAGAIKEDTECSQLLYQAWYLDDGILAGKKSSIRRSLSLLQELGPPFGLYINISKCELYCLGDTPTFPSELKVSHLPHFEILGCPIGDYILPQNVSKHTSCCSS